jgi:hypothetical protein
VVTYTAIAPGGLNSPAGGTLTAGPGGGAHYTKPPNLLGPGQGGMEQRLADIGLARAQTSDPKKTMALVYKEAVEKQRRLTVVKAALKRRLKPATRKRLTDEATQLVGDINALSAVMYDLSGGQAGVSSEGIRGGTAAAAADIASKTGGGDTGSVGADTSGGSGADSQGPPTQLDYTLAALSRTRLTDSLDDDIYETTILKAIRKNEMDTALADGDPRNDDAAISAYLEVRDSLDSLTKATQQNTDALDTARADLAAELKRQTDFAISVQSTSGFQAEKYLTDLISGRLGRGVVSRGFTPGNATEYAY